MAPSSLPPTRLGRFREVVPAQRLNPNQAQGHIAGAVS